MNKLLVYVLPPAFYLLVALAGRQFTSAGIATWYPSLQKPSFTPPGSIIGIVWTLIYILSAASLIQFLRAAKGKPLFAIIIGLYILNGIINAAWSYIFFSRHLLMTAVIDAALIAFTVLIMIVSVWNYSKISAFLLAPYFLWASFATFLSYTIFRLN
ncbi:MAG: tryptophan-rich sensory protein [Nitrospirota bacterium]|nr:tryptophan-rich sensory protein [Nitrospirota bacterium]